MVKQQFGVTKAEAVKTTYGGLTAQQVFDFLATRPSYKVPTIAVTTPSSTSVEVGTSVITADGAAVECTFTPNNSGGIDGTTGTIKITQGSATETITGTVSGNKVSGVARSRSYYAGSTQIKVDVTVNHKAQTTFMKYSFGGNEVDVESREGAVDAGTTTGSRTVTAYRNWYYGSDTKANVLSLTSGLIRGKSVGGSGNGSKNLTVPGSSGGFFVAVPTGSTVKVTQLGADITSNLTKGTVSVTGANNRQACNYDVYTYVGAGATLGASSDYVITVSNYKPNLVD